MTHVPVLADTICAFVPTGAQRIIDATVGVGGHAKAMLSKAPRAELLAIDRDELTLSLARATLAPYADRVNLMVADFSELGEAARDIGWEWVNVVLFDLGVSSVQLDDPSRGLSFTVDGPLDMRLDRRDLLTAADIVNTRSERELEILLRLGEEPFARRIAQAIVSARRRQPILTTRQLAELVSRVIPAQRRKMHPATHTFRALRMAVNHELESLQAALPQASDLLAHQGILMVVSFHSLEDRLVKQYLRSDPTLVPQTKQPIMPGQTEIRQNLRSRSAKLRVATKTTDSRPRAVEAMARRR